MDSRNRISLLNKTFYVFILLALLIAVFDAGGASSAAAKKLAVPGFLTKNIISNGQFVYGPNVDGFVLKDYLERYAPHLLMYSDDLNGRAEYYSVNPKIYLTFLEISTHLITDPYAAFNNNPLGLNTGDFPSQIDALSNKMLDAYYSHLYGYSTTPVSQRHLPLLASSTGIKIELAPDINAGTFAIMAGLVAIDQQDLNISLDNNQTDGFYQTYLRLFANDDPLDETNHIYIPDEVGAVAAPDSLMQLPFLRGLSWRFGGVHNTSGGSTFTDASSLDFYPWPIAWGADTSNMWVVAAGPGIPQRLSACGYKIIHTDGWETFYYHLENTQYITGSIKQNEKIGVIANTLQEATCTGGAASGPHVHFSLRRNGAFVAINGSRLSGWYIHAGRYSYDTDPNYMWVEKSGTKKYAYRDTLTSEGTETNPVVLSSMRANPNPTTSKSVGFTVRFSNSVSGVGLDDFTLTTTGINGAGIVSVSGGPAIYKVAVSTGTGIGTLRLNIIDNDTILDSGSNPLGGPGDGNGDYLTGQKYTLDRNNKFTSSAALDGWVAESGENTSQGGTLDNTGVLRLGDDALNRQYRSFLSFDTSSLPNNAVIVKATLKIKRSGISGANPFSTHGPLLADIHKGYFGASPALLASDFQFKAAKPTVGSFSPLGQGWYQLIITAPNLSTINKFGLTQFRLRFTLDDNNDLGSDFAMFHSGNSLTAAYRPIMIVEYTLP